MTDRSNYGPVRRLSPVSADNRKPYSRTGLKGVLGTLDLNSGDVAVHTTPDSPYYPFHVETPQLEAPTQNRPIAHDGPRDIPGFPTYEQYLRIEEEYLTSLSERKQPKALISQALFDKIFAVLQNGSEDRASTAQFRFWVRKMFVLVYPQTSFVSRASSNSLNAGQSQAQSQAQAQVQSTDPVVLHDKRPVAIKEQLYEVLCYCHAVSRHGGRDKTCATLRLHYSWVPKELTAKFVKACPTCTLKRSGNPDLLSQFGQAVVQRSQSQSPSPYAPPQTLPVVEPGPFLFPGGPNDSPPSLSFIVGSAGCDDAGGGGSFAPSIFTTPDLSVYPSPTLSAASFGPMTPSPFLSSGLFGYPAVFDPGHGSSLSSVAGWDPSPFSPCVQMYTEDLRTGITREQVRPVGAEDVIDMRAFGMQLHLPTPRAVRALRTRAHDCGSGADSDAWREGDSNGGGRGVDAFSSVVGTPCPVDTSNIDPVLLTEEGYPPLNLVGPPVHATTVAGAVSSTDTDADADTDTDVDMDVDNCESLETASGGSHFLRLAATWETRTPVVRVSTGMGSGSGAARFAGPSSPLSPVVSPYPTPTPTPTHSTMTFAMPAHMPGPVPISLVGASAPVSVSAFEASLRTRMMAAQGAMGVGTRTALAEVEKAMLSRLGADVDVDVDVDIEDVDRDGSLGGFGPPPTGRLRIEDARWDSLEAWLVRSDSMDDDAAASDDMA